MRIRMTGNMKIKELLVVFFYKVVGAPFRLFPIQKKRIVFEAYYGKGFEDSPSVIASELAKQGIDGLEMIWLVRKIEDAKSLPLNIRPIKRFSLAELYYISTAKVWIDNCRKNRGIVKRKSQYYIQTWHGGLGAKKVEKDAVDSLSPGYVKNAIHDSKIADLFLSGSRWETDLFRKSFWYDGEVLEEGLPRNDIFFRANDSIIKKVRLFYQLDNNVKIAIYAPTFRQSETVYCYDLDYEKVLGELSVNWGNKWVILIRMHPSAMILQHEFKYSEGILNGSLYPEMNDLIIASDLLISDYSSCMFDAMLVNKRVIRYASDIKLYSAERGFYFDYDELPFPLAENNDEMSVCIRNYDYNMQIDRQCQFLQACGSVECGVAAKKITSRILERMDCNG